MTRLTDEQLDDISTRIRGGICHLCEGLKQTEYGAECLACCGTGAFALSSDVTLEILAELREGRTR